MRSERTVLVRNETAFASTKFDFDGDWDHEVLRRAMLRVGACDGERGARQQSGVGHGSDGTSPSR